MALKDIVDVQISRTSAAITQVGFGTLAFVYDATEIPSDRVLVFGGAEEVDADDDLSDVAKGALRAAFSGQLRPQRVKAIYRLVDQSETADNETYVEALEAAAIEDPDWYGVTIQSRTSSDILAVAAWVEARPKLFIAATNAVEVLSSASTGDIGYLLNAASYSRTALIYAADAATSWPDTGWAGGMLPRDPGSASWAFKRVPGVQGQSFTAAEITALEAKRVTRVETILGLSQTIGGYTSDAGSFVDLVRGVDWLTQRLMEDIFLRFANVPKIPYTNRGIAIVEGVVRARLTDAVERDVIADDEDFSVTVPDINSTFEVDRANRVLRGVEFTARLAGAIHKVIVRGSVTI